MTRPYHRTAVCLENPLQFLRISTVLYGQAFVEYTLSSPTFLINGQYTAGLIYESVRIHSSVLQTRQVGMGDSFWLSPSLWRQSRNFDFCNSFMPSHQHPPEYLANGTVHSNERHESESSAFTSVYKCKSAPSANQSCPSKVVSSHKSNFSLHVGLLRSLASFGQCTFPNPKTTYVAIRAFLTISYFHCKL